MGEQWNTQEKDDEGVYLEYAGVDRTLSKCPISKSVALRGEDCDGYAQ